MDMDFIKLKDKDGFIFACIDKLDISNIRVFISINETIHKQLTVYFKSNAKPFKLYFFNEEEYFKFIRVNGDLLGLSK